MPNTVGFDFAGRVQTRAQRLTRLQEVQIAVRKRLKAMPTEPTKLLFDVTTLPPGARVLVRRQFGLGDVLMLTPTIRQMALRYGLLVDVQTLSAYQPLFRLSPHVRASYPMEREVPPGHYGALIDFDEADEPYNAEQPNRIRHFAASVGLHLADEEMGLDYFPADGEATRALKLLARLPRPRLAFAWSSNVQNRNWSAPVREEAIRRILAAGGSVVALAAQPQAVSAAPGVLDLTGQVPDLRRVAALLLASDGVIAPDTGLFHLAAALNVPLLTYFGAFSLAQRSAPRQMRLTLINDPTRCPEAPCRSYDCPFADVARQSPCLLPDWDRFDGWVQERKTGGERA